MRNEFKNVLSSNFEFIIATLLWISRDGIKSETRLGPYEIVSAIGAGGMGEVYRARDPRLKREVAAGLSRSGFLSLGLRQWEPVAAEMKIRV